MGNTSEGSSCEHSVEVKGFSAIILAGGKSSRMGQKKSTLPFNGKSFIDIIIQKLEEIGFEDIIISGYDYNKERYTYVEDKYQDKGPLAGIHAGLEKAVNQSVLVITEDAPLIPEDYISSLMKKHREGKRPITVAECGGRLQPLLGIYDKNLIPLCDSILQGDKAAPMFLIERAGCEMVSFQGDELLIRGCNTPEEYERLKLLS